MVARHVLLLELLAAVLLFVAWQAQHGAWANTHCLTCTARLLNAQHIALHLSVIHTACLLCVSLLWRPYHNMFAPICLCCKEGSMQLLCPAGESRGKAHG